MKTHAEKRHANKNRSAAIEPVAGRTGSDSGIMFSDQRAEARSRGRLHRIAADSRRVRQFAAVRNMADHGPGSRAFDRLQQMADSQASRRQPTLQAKKNATGLPDRLKAGIENLSGFSMDDVEVHYRSARPAKLQAHAFAQGREIHLGPGQEKHLPHEAWHVVQQKQGRVRPTATLPGGGKINADVALETEADRMGASALRASVSSTDNELAGQRAAVAPPAPAGRTSPARSRPGVAQMKGDVVEDIALEGYKKNKKRLKATLQGCIVKFRTTIKTALENNDGSQEYEDLQEVLSEDGRDAFFYRRLWWKNRTGLLGDLERWAPGWSVARTGGLLADLGLALKDVDLAIFTGGLQFDDIMNEEYLQEGSHHVRGRGPLRSDWADDIAQSGIKGNAGPSSTTTQLLHVASSMGVFSNIEIQAMMVALVKFWMKGTKRAFGGGYHTAAEVWAPYMGYLEAQRGQPQEAEE